MEYAEGLSKYKLSLSLTNQFSGAKEMVCSLPLLSTAYCRKSPFSTKKVFLQRSFCLSKNWSFLTSLFCSSSTPPELSFSFNLGLELNYFLSLVLFFFYFSFFV